VILTQLIGDSPIQKNGKPVSVSKGTAVKGHMSHSRLRAIGKPACQHINSITAGGHTFVLNLEDSLRSRSISLLIMLLLQATRTLHAFGLKDSLASDLSTH
jgi:hypothetical protein